MAEWSAHRTRNSAVALGFVLGRSEFKPSAMLENSQLVASCQLEFLILFC